MNVSLSSRPNKGKRTYHMRWKQAGRWKSKAAGTDRKKALKMAGLLEDKLNKGEHRELTRTPWQEFADDHVSKVVGTACAYDTRLTLTDFGTVCSPSRVDAVEFTDVERYVSELRRRGLRASTRNKKVKILKHCFRMAVKRGAATRNPMAEWKLEPTPEPEVRTISPAEESLLTSSARVLYGLPMAAFIHAGIRLGGRIGELTALTWDRVDLDGRTALFILTKTGADRRIPFGDSVANMLLQLKARTLVSGGPWCGNTIPQLTGWWKAVRDKAGLKDITPHTMRKTFITRLFNVGTPPKTVMRLAGHKKLATTTAYYTEVNATDLRDAIAKIG